VLAGHRDGWAAFLADLRVGGDIVIETYGARAIYHVASTEVVRFDDVRA